MKFDLPLNNYYKDGVIDFWTISNKGGWWTAVVLHTDPKSEKTITSIYRWQRRNDAWKKSGSVRIKNKDAARRLISSLNECLQQLPD